MRKGMLLFAVVCVALTCHVLAEDSQRTAGDPNPWHVANVETLANARPGADTASPEDGIRKYLHIQVGFDRTPDASRKHLFRVIDARGEEVGRLWGWNDRQSLVIFEGQWDTLAGLYLEGLDHREPLFAVRQAEVKTPPAVATVPVVPIQPNVATVVDRPRVGVEIDYPTPVIGPQRVVVEQPDQVIHHGTDRIVHHGGSNQIVREGGGQTHVYGGGERHVYHQGGDRIVHHHGGGGVQHVYGTGGGTAVRGGDVTHVHDGSADGVTRMHGAGVGGVDIGAGAGIGTGAGVGSGTSVEPGAADQLGDAIAMGPGTGPGAGPGPAPGTDPAVGAGPGQGSGEGTAPGQGPGTAPGQGAGEGMAPGQGAGEGTAPGQGPGSAPGQGAGEGMAPGQGAGEGTAPGQVPGEGMAPGEGPATGSGDAQQKTCPDENGQPQTCPEDGPAPAEGTAQAPGEGPGVGPGVASAQGPGEGPGVGPAEGPGTGPGAGPGGGGRSSGGPDGGPLTINPKRIGPQVVGPRVIRPDVDMPVFRDPRTFYDPRVFYDPRLQYDPRVRYGDYRPGEPGYGTGYGGGGGGGGQYTELARAGLKPELPKPEVAPAFVLYVAAGEEGEAGKVYQLDENGRVLGWVNLPFQPSGIALHREKGLVVSLPRDGGRLMYIDDTGKVSTLVEKDKKLVHPTDVAVGAGSDTILAADNIADSLVATSTGGITPKEYRRFEGQKWHAQDMSIAITRDGHVIFGTDGDKGVYRFSGDGSESESKPLLPEPGGVAADTKTLQWAATQNPKEIYVFEGEELMKTLRLPAGKSHYRNGLLSFSPAGSLCVVARDGQETVGEPWFLMYNIEEDKIRSLFPWQKETMTDFVVGPRMFWDRNSPNTYKSPY